MHQMVNVAQMGLMVGAGAEMLTAAAGLLAVNEVIKANPVTAAAAKVAMADFTNAVQMASAAAAGEAVPKILGLGNVLAGLGYQVGATGAEQLNTTLDTAANLARHATQALHDLGPAIGPAITGLGGVGQALLDGISNPSTVAQIKAVGDALSDPRNVEGMTNLVSGAVSVGSTLTRTATDVVGTVGSVLGADADKSPGPALAAGVGGWFGAKRGGVGGGAAGAVLGGGIQAIAEADQRAGKSATPGMLGGAGGALLGGRVAGPGGAVAGGILGEIAAHPDMLRGPEGARAKSNPALDAAGGLLDSWKNNETIGPGGGLDKALGIDKPSSVGLPGDDWMKPPSDAGKPREEQSGLTGLSTDLNEFFGMGEGPGFLGKGGGLDQALGAPPPGMQDSALGKWANEGGGGAGGGTFAQPKTVQDLLPGGPSLTTEGLPPGWPGASAPGGMAPPAGGPGSVGGPGGNGAITEQLTKGQQNEQNSAHVDKTSGKTADQPGAGNAGEAQGVTPENMAAGLAAGAGFAAVNKPPMEYGHDEGFSSGNVPTSHATQTNQDVSGKTHTFVTDMPGLPEIGEAVGRADNGLGPGQVAAGPDGNPVGFGPGPNTWGPTGPPGQAPSPGQAPGPGPGPGPAGPSAAAQSFGALTGFGTPGVSAHGAPGLGPQSAAVVNGLTQAMNAQSNAGRNVAQQNQAVAQSNQAVANTANTASNATNSQSQAQSQNTTATQSNTTANTANAQSNQAVTDTSTSAATAAAGLGQAATAAAPSVGAVADSAASAPAAMGAATSAVAGAAAGMGSAMGMGMAEGISDSAPAADAAAADAASSAGDSASAAAGTDSPSRVWKQLGSYMSEGMAIGITATAPMAGGSAAQAVMHTTGVASNYAKDAGLKLGFLYGTNIVTGLSSVLDKEGLKAAGLAEGVKSPLAKVALGQLGLLGPAGSGASSWDLHNAGMVSFGSGSAPASSGGTPAVEIHLSMDGQPIKTAAENVVFKNFEALLKAVAAAKR